MISDVGVGRALFLGVDCTRFSLSIGSGQQDARGSRGGGGSGGRCLFVMRKIMLTDP
jgi:hypothetical protein